MELKSLGEFYKAYENAWWITATLDEAADKSNDEFGDVLALRSAVGALRPDYENDILHVMDSLVDFHKAGCPEEDEDTLVMMDFPTFQETLDKAQRVILAPKNKEMTDLLNKLASETEDEAADREMKELADLLQKDELNKNFGESVRKVMEYEACKNMPQVDYALNGGTIDGNSLPPGSVIGVGPNGGTVTF